MHCGFAIRKIPNSLPQTYPLTGRGTFLHPFFGRLNSRAAYALLPFHLRLHVPQIRRSIEINGRK